MKIDTPRLMICDFTPDMARAVHLGSLDADMRSFLPDEVFETEEIAAEVIADLTECAASGEGPFVHPCLLQDGTYVGYVQFAPAEGGYEVGYHIVAAHTGRGYATEALTAFLPVMMARLQLTQVLGICDARNVASIRVLEKCDFRPVFTGDAPYQGTIRPIVKMIFSI
ncbi:MAG: GNAT family N-acetyltransferase [Clostridia bacterium]|nr:GNAT family N-acetyltransferase [Clostridia bacterium]